MHQSGISNILKVITVDDSPVITQRVGFILSEIDKINWVATANNMSSALLIINEHQPHAVILDIHLAGDLPYASGLTLLSHLRKAYPDMKIILFTNQSDFHYHQKCKAWGADYFLDKSYDYDKIPQVLEEIRLHL